VPEDKGSVVFSHWSRAGVEEVLSRGEEIPVRCVGVCLGSSNVNQRLCLTGLIDLVVFVYDLCEAGGSFPIVQAVVTMALARRMSTTAEGVETDGQRALLRKLGCTQMQGFLFSPAVSAEHIKKLLFGQDLRGASVVARPV
jgi:predicted signal transduction protein with EAL and GGDEF domain